MSGSDLLFWHEGGIVLSEFIGKRLKELRAARRLTQEAVARGINCSSVTYSRYENGKREPSLEMLAKLAEFYGVSIDHLFGNKPPAESELSDYELDLLKALRNVPDSVKDDILDFLNMKMSKREALK